MSEAAKKMETPPAETVEKQEAPIEQVAEKGSEHDREQAERVIAETQGELDGLLDELEGSVDEEDKQEILDEINLVREKLTKLQEELSAMTSEEINLDEVAQKRNTGEAQIINMKAFREKMAEGNNTEGRENEDSRTPEQRQEIQKQVQDTLGKKKVFGSNYLPGVEARLANASEGDLKSAGAEQARLAQIFEQATPDTYVQVLSETLNIQMPEGATGEDVAEYFNKAKENLVKVAEMVEKKVGDTAKEKADLVEKLKEGSIEDTLGNAKEQMNDLSTELAGIYEQPTGVDKQQDFINNQKIQKLSSQQQFIARTAQNLSIGKYDQHLEGRSDAELTAQQTEQLRQDRGEIMNFQLDLLKEKQGSSSEQIQILADAYDSGMLTFLQEKGPDLVKLLEGEPEWSEKQVDYYMNKTPDGGQGAFEHLQKLYDIADAVAQNPVVAKTLKKSIDLYSKKTGQYPTLLGRTIINNKQGLTRAPRSIS